MNARSRPSGFAAPWRVVGFLTVTLATLLAGCSRQAGTDSANDSEFLRLMNVGKSLYEKSDAAKAIEAFQKAVSLDPANTDARLNLANAHLLAGDANGALQQATEVLNVEPNSAAAHFVLGCAYLRLSKFDDAIKSLQPAKDIDRAINPVSFQLGRAFQGAGKFDQEGISDRFDFPPTVQRDDGADDLAVLFEQLKGQLLVPLGERAVAHHVREHDDRETPLPLPFERRAGNSRGGGIAWLHCNRRRMQPGRNGATL